MLSSFFSFEPISFKDELVSISHDSMPAVSSMFELSFAKKSLKFSFV